MVKIFVGRLADSVEKKDLEDIFQEYGEVTDCSVLKNYGFVHMADLNEAKAAITGLDKHELKGNAINVELSTTKVQKATKIFVGNLPPETKSSDIHKLFKKYGTVIECDVVKNYAFVHMGRDTMAREAIQALNNTDYNGNKISVQMARAKQSDMNGGGPMYGDYHRGGGRPRGGMHHPMRPFMPPPPPRSRMGGMMGGPRYMRKPPGYMHDPYMSSPYMRPSARGGSMMRHPSRMHHSHPPSPHHDIAAGYGEGGRGGHRGDMASPYMVGRDRESLAPPPSPYASPAAASAYPPPQRYNYASDPASAAASAPSAQAPPPVAGNGGAPPPQSPAVPDRYAAAAPSPYGTPASYSRAAPAQQHRYAPPPSAAAGNGRYAPQASAAPVAASAPPALPATVADQYAGAGY